MENEATDLPPLISLGCRLPLQRHPQPPPALPRGAQDRAQPQTRPRRPHDRHHHRPRSPTLGPPLPARLQWRCRGTALPVVVFFHGGGFAFLSAASLEYDAVCRRFCRKLSVAVVSVNYRLSPEHRFPAQYDDGLDVLHFLESNVDIPGGGLLREFFEAADLSNCFIAGDSAGANIAHHVARRWSAGERPSEARIRLSGLVAIQPFFGGEERVDSEIRLAHGPVVTTDRTDWLWKAFLPDGATRDHEAANPEAAAAELGESFPPVVVMVGEFDPLRDWQLKYFRSLRLRGKKAEIIEYAGAIHAFYAFPELKSSAVMIEDLRSFILRETCRRQNGSAVDAVAQ
ncbi:unnamed protein product [Spirodela intermedia]|uniref:Alpha/beta hydrolase fold-3 domain-containing protein n=1 Tax=Spirodela intermedia TaxID=51605 RepID=A0A7I8IQH7_SPIIN|nr:unnamed protein product [Spirodela intermedia]CAA6660190.1 unnamed protein product [Spirodela intermedia]